MRHFVWESGVRKEVTREEAIEMDKVENEGRMKAIEELEKLVVRLDVYAVRHGDAHIEGITVELETILAALKSSSAVAQQLERSADTRKVDGAIPSGATKPSEPVIPRHEIEGLSDLINELQEVAESKADNSAEESGASEAYLRCLHEFRHLLSTYPAPAAEVKG